MFVMGRETEVACNHHLVSKKWVHLLHLLLVFSFILPTELFTLPQQSKEGFMVSN